MKLPANIRENIPLAPLTTFGVGGPARYFAQAADEQQVLEAVSFARQNQLPLFVLGGGSNLVVSDVGFHGLVLKIAICGMDQHDSGGKRVFNVAAGEDWDGFVARAVDQDCAGIETLSGIPGSVGGTPVQNVGAYGEEVSETITSVRVLDLESLRTRELSNAECGFAYRTSIFNTTQRDKYIVLRVSYALTPNGIARLEYADLKKHFAQHPGTPTLIEVRNAVRQIRHSKGMLIVEGDPDCRSAGSFFKNPIVPEAVYQEIVRRIEDLSIVPPKYPAGVEGHVKLSAAWLVEHAGFRKGYGSGPAGISTKHTLAIVNRGRATAADIVALKTEIQNGVRGRFSIDLHPEPVFLGF